MGFSLLYTRIALHLAIMIKIVIIFGIENLQQNVCTKDKYYVFNVKF